MKPKALLPLLAIASACSISQAATLFTFDFDTARRSSVPVGSGSDVNIVSAALVSPEAAPYVGTPLYNSRSYHLSNQSNISSSNPYAFMSGAATPSSSAVAEGNTAYQSFTISISGLNAGQTISLESLSFNYGPSINGVFSGSALSVGVYSSLTGFTDGAFLGGATLHESANDVGTIVTVDLTSENSIAGTAFTSLVNGTEVEFRLYFGDNFTSSSRRHIITDLSVMGVIPEPSTYALCAGSLALLASAYRRKLRAR